MKESWRDWPETQKLQVNLRLLLARPNGRKIANHLLEETSALLTYKSNRKGTWANVPSWVELLGDK